MSVRAVTDDEVRRFQENGWAHLPGLVDRDTVARVLEIGEQALRDGAGMTGFGATVDRCFLPFPGGDRTGFMGKDMMLSPTMGQNASRMLDIARVRLFADAFLLKKPRTEGTHDGTLYHQDFAATPVDRSSFMGVWIALHDMPADAGVMRFYNRSHRIGVLGYAFADGISLADRCTAALQGTELSPPLIMKAGDATVHHALVVHGSPPNTTTANRWAYSMTLMDADARQNGAPAFPPGVKVERFATLDDRAFPLVPAA